MSSRIAHNAIPCKWKGEDFPSFTALDNHLGNVQGYSRQYWKKGIDLLEYPVIADQGINQHRRWTDKKMIQFCAFVSVRKKEMGEVGLKGMLEKFKERNKQ